MKEVKVKLYKFEELSEESKKKVIDRERDRIQQYGIDAWDYEHRGTLKKFAEIVGIKVINWEVSSCDHYFQFYFLDDVYERDAEEVTGKYLLRFLNSIYYEIRSRKFYYCGHSSSRHSKILWEEMNCPLTGVCYDCDILSPIYDWHKNPDWKISLKDLVRKCLESFFCAWEDECEYFGSDEYVTLELIEASPYENVLYFEDGTVFNGIYEDVA